MQKLYGAPGRWVTVLKNLLNNAYKYAGQEAEIRLIAYDHTIIIEDSGVGMKPEILANVFAIKTTTEGNGLRLMICKKIIDDHKFTIQCTSRENFGTRFVIGL
jgi:signal transduction histidine kinase